MLNEYLLPCHCGETHRVSPRQSGETLACTCGARLDVPTLRELKTLEPAPMATSAAAKPAWGPRQRLLFVGLLVAAVSLIAGGYFRFVEMPKLPEIATRQSDLEKVKPAEAWQFWVLVRHGMPPGAPPDLAQALEGIEVAQRKIRIALGVGIAGLLVAASGFLVAPTKAG